MKHQSSRFVRFFKNKWVIALIIILIIVGAYILTHRGTKVTLESATVVTGNVAEKVSVTGTVSPVDKADLAFQKSGVISKISVKVGDHVKKGDPIASIESRIDAANLESVKAQLADLQRGLRPEEYALDQANLSSASITLTNAKKNALNSLHDSYVKAQGALVNYTDTFFTNAQSANPTLDVRIGSTISQIAINNERVQVSDTLARWKQDTDSITSGDVDATQVENLMVRAQGYLATIKTFMSDLSNSIDKVTTSNSGLSQTLIDQEVTTMNSGLSSLTQAIATLTTADSNLKDALSGYTQAQNQFTLQKAGSSADTIAAQAAKVKEAQATLDNDSIVSPIDGLVTKADPHVGEFASVGQSGFSVQSENNYKIEAYVPEADIAKVALQNHAQVTLDAYGAYVFFPATVTTIDPAETVLEGVPTYKVTLYFDQADARIRSGMTANTDILTHEVDNVLSVPTRAIIDDAGKKSIRILNADGKTFTSVPVEVGLKGSDGTTQIISGVHEGEKVVTYVK